MKKIFYSVLFTLICAITMSLQAQTFFSEGFEAGIPSNWSQQYLSSTASWYIEDGGLDGDHPDGAYSGAYNAILQQNGSSKITRLVTPQIDLSDALKAQLNFAVAMTTYVGTDELYIDVRIHPDSSWVNIASYTTEIEDWVLEELQIPDSLCSENSAIGFRGKTNYGGGICIDAVEIVEVGFVSLYVKSIEASNFRNGFAPTGTDNNPVFRAIVNVVGNTGSLTMEEITFQSKNTDDNDIEPGGLTLFYNKDTLLNGVIAVAGGQNFSSGEVTFDGLSVPLTFGKNVFWLTYNIKGDNAHSRHDNRLDVSINADDILISSTSYPLDNIDPPGYQVVKEALFFDNFEEGVNWSLTGEFEIDSVQGLGVTGTGNPDPNRAVSTPNVLGTDITGLGATAGAYENNIEYNEYSAISPYVNIDFYKDVTLNYWRWLNIDYFDLATIDVQKNLSGWSNVWYNSVYSNDNYWNMYTNLLDAEYNYKDSIQIRFAIGPADEENNQSGWNIDNFAILGDYIEYDVGVVAWIEPDCGCSHTSSEPVTIAIANLGGMPTPINLPVRYSIDNGNTWVEETYSSSIPINDTAVFTFSQTADFSAPGEYKILTETRLSADEWQPNNRFDTIITATPNYPIPYVQSFENGSDFWSTGGINGRWEIRSPHFALTGPYIDTAYHGVKCWVTNYEGTYKPNDSSYIETPCFDFSSSNAPILEMAIYTDFEQNVDGANMYYSIDGGETWSFLPESPTYSLNWYTNNSIESLENPGWDQSNSGWFVARNLLPSDVVGNSAVRFRIYIEANEDTQNEGIAIDRFRIYEAPYDLGITALNYPQTACELSNAVQPIFELTNLGAGTVPAGSQVPISLHFNNEFILIETFTLPADLDVNDVQTLTFDEALYMDTAGSYSLRLINKFDDGFDFYGNDNDTLYSDVNVIGMPQYNPWPNITGKASALLVELDAGDYAGYDWEHGFTGNPYFAFNEGWYKVTVTNDDGCTATDSTKVVNSLKDVELTQIFTTLEDSCERIDQVYFEIELTNIGEQYTAGEKLPIAYSINDNPPVLDSIVLASLFDVGNTVQYTFTEGADFSQPGEYFIKVYSNIEDDLDLSNDTIYDTINTWGAPQTAFMVDTIYTSQVDTLVLDAGEGFDSYYWQDGSDLQTYNVSSDVSSMYTVIINDVNSCGPTKDSIYVNTQDIDLVEIVSPATACGHAIDEQITFTLNNNSGNTIPAGETIDFNVLINGTISAVETYTLTENIGPHITTPITLSTGFDFADTGIYEIVLWSSNYLDTDPENDSVDIIIQTIGYPNVDLIYDTVYTSRPDTLIFDAGNQFESYIWQDGSGLSFFEADQDTSYVYSVTVSNNDGCGVDKDSVQVFTNDLELIKIENPESACELSDQQYFSLRWKNVGPDNIYPGENYTLSYKVEDNDWVSQTFTINQKVESGDEFIKQIQTPIDMSAFQRYSIMAAIEFSKDVASNNDTVSKTIETYGYPEIQIGADTLNTLQPDTVEIVVTPSDYISYAWNVGVVNDTLSLDTVVAGNYVVTVYDIYGCSARDSIYVNSRNASVSRFVSPSSDCSNSGSEGITVQIKNSGFDTIRSGEILNISLLQPEVESDQIILETDMAPGEYYEHMFDATADMIAVGSYDFSVQVGVPLDLDPDDDVLDSNIVTYGPAQVDLGNEITVNSLPFTLDAGADFVSYLWHDGSVGQTFDISTSDITSTGLYSVTVTNDLGCEGSDSRRVHVNIIDWAADEVITPFTGCFSDQYEGVVLQISNQSEAPVRPGRSFSVSYSLNGNDNVNENFTTVDTIYPLGIMEYNFDQIPNYEFGEPNVIQIFLDNPDDNNTENDDISKSFIIYDPEFAFEEDTIRITVFPYTIEVPSGYQSYSWSTGDETQSISVSEFGWYSVTVSDLNGCYGTDSVCLVDPNSLNVVEKYKFSIWPNPVNNELFVQLKDKSGRYNIELVSVTGAVAYHEEQELIEGVPHSIPVGSLAEGVYIIKLYNENTYSYRSFIIRR
jgi:hypothetical protein